MINSKLEAERAAWQREAIACADAAGRLRERAERAEAEVERLLRENADLQFRLAREAMRALVAGGASS